MSGGVHILLLAAGASRRMQGEDKLLREAAGEPLLKRALHHACESSAMGVSVVLPVGNHARAHLVQGMDAKPVICEDWREGMGASLRAGIAAFAGCDAVIVALADMPDLTAAHYNAMVNAFNALPDDVRSRAILRAVSESGQPGHPVLFGVDWFQELAASQGDQGARAILGREKGLIRLVPTPGEGAVTDLDTAEAWAAWEAKQGKST